MGLKKQRNQDESPPGRGHKDLCLPTYPAECLSNDLGEQHSLLFIYFCLAKRSKHKKVIGGYVS